MLRLPLTGSAVRDLFDIAHLAEVADPKNRAKLVTFREALSNARRAMEADKAVRSVVTFAFRANGELWLIKVGPRGGWKTLWNFGTL